MNEPPANTPGDLRAFVSLPLPPAVAEPIATFQRALQRHFRDVTWTRPHALHVTLHFLGRVPAHQLPALIQALRPISPAHPCLDLQPHGLGTFADRVLWLGLRGATAELRSLAEAVRGAAHPLGSHVEKNDFHAHITLGRFRRRAHHLESSLRQLRPPTFPAWTADAFQLLHSDLGPVAHYTTLASFPLAPRAPQ